MGVDWCEQGAGSWQLADPCSAVPCAAVQHAVPCRAACCAVLLFAALRCSIAPLLDCCTLILSLRLIGHIDTSSVAISAQGLRAEVRGIFVPLISEGG